MYKGELIMSRKRTKYTNISYDDTRHKYYVTMDYGKDDKGNRIKPTKTFKTLEEAKEALAQFTSKKNPVKPSKLSFGDFLDMYCDYKDDIDAHTSNYNYRNIVNKHLKLILGNIPVQGIKIGDIEKYFIIKAKKNPDNKDGLSLNTLQRHRELLQSAFKYGIRYELVETNVVEKMLPLKNLIKNADTEFEHVILTAKETKDFLKCLDGNFFRIGYFIAVETGMRRGEIMGLKWENVDLHNSTITIKETRTQAGGVEVKKGPKSKKGYRTLCITKNLTKELSLLKNEYEANKVKYGDEFVDNGYVICHSNGELPVVNAFSNNLRNLRKALDLKHFRIHDLRHTALSAIYKSGMTDVEVAAIAGHSSPNFTRSTYLGNAEDPAPKASEIMAKLLYDDIA